MTRVIRDPEINQYHFVAAPGSDRRESRADVSDHRYAREMEAASVVMVTSRAPRDALYRELAERVDIVRIGDCLAPSTLASAVYSGHRYARDMDAAPPDGVSFQRERALVP
jgi:dimethylamine/trimethylamine dehydrogenase